MLQNNSQITKIPLLGSGLGYRRELKKEIIANKERIDFLEVITDGYIHNDAFLDELAEICDIFPVIPHGIGLSIGSIDPLDKAYLQAIKHISDITRSPYYSEHLCMTRVPGIDIGHLSPLWFTQPVLDNVIRNVASLQDYLGKPLILENVTYLFHLPSGELTQTEFFQKLIDATGCGVLLDVTNVYINSVNHNYDPIRFMENMPLSSIVQVHLAGGYWAQGVLIDGHSEPVQEESWNLLKALVSRAAVKGIILEHDNHFPEIEILLKQVQRARNIMQGMRELC